MNRDSKWIIVIFLVVFGVCWIGGNWPEKKAPVKKVKPKSEWSYIAYPEEKTYMDMFSVRVK
ncbi:unnamed protein product [marine sediment metagenome]|uniref:Uncharacterized protein n=1 Tax=marine sediment metagenome TaxID=412755 RepID=X1FAE2_9ZZZZ